jgi:hypothetical protein
MITNLIVQIMYFWWCFVKITGMHTINFTPWCFIFLFIEFKPQKEDGMQCYFILNYKQKSIFQIH